MKKEIITVFLIIGLPTVFIMLIGGGITGVVPYEVSNLRVERINLYLAFPQDSGFYKAHTYRVREALRYGSRNEYYQYNGLASTKGHLFFDSEIGLVQELLTLSCLQPVGFVEDGMFITPGGAKFILPGSQFNEVPYAEISQVPCDPELQALAVSTLHDILRLDQQLVDYTIGYSSCPGQAIEARDMAKGNIAQGLVEASLNNLRIAWSKATFCK